MVSSAIFLAIAASLIAAPGPLFIKLASSHIKLDPLSFLNKNLFIGAAFYSVSIVFTILALSQGDLSVVGPIFSLVYVWVTLISIKFLNEKVSMKQVIGIMLVVLGIALVGSGL